jgi:superfamily I DNA/RNA helicase
MILSALDAAPHQIKMFHAIFVDEGQDFNLSWWNMLRRVLRDDGEMMIAFDTAQQIYPTTDWNSETLPGAGFAGRWIELKASRRLPNRMLPILRSFAQQYHPSALDSLPSEQSELDEPCDVRWVQVQPQDRLESCVKELMRIIQRDPAPVSRAMTDLTLLCDLREDCLKAEALLEERGIAVTNTVGRDDREDRRRKKDFTMRAPRVKVCTFQSYKGWQSRLIVLSIARFNDADRSAALLYTMLTRLKRHPHGSSLTIVSSASRLKIFGSRFQDFDDRT